MARAGVMAREAQLRMERAKLNPAKDKERVAQLAPYLAKLQKLETHGRDTQTTTDEFRWLIEEFKVSLFAQELGTAVPVSPQRLDQFLTAAGV